MEMVSTKQNKTEYVSVRVEESDDDDDASIGSQSSTNGRVPSKSRRRYLNDPSSHYRWVWVGIGCFVLVSAIVTFYTASSEKSEQESRISRNPGEDASTSNQCEFRQYPPHRFYGLNRTNEIYFLNTTKYLWGKYPTLLAVKKSAKICIDQSKWQQGNVPFADATNPSVLSVTRIKKHLPDNHEILSFMEQKGAHYLASVTFKYIMACEYPFPDNRPTPETMRTVLVMLDEHMQTITQTTLVIELDADWGFRKQIKTGDLYERQMIIFDDARLFVHGGQVWAGYKHYDSGRVLMEVQMFSPLKFEINKDTWEAIAPASQTRYACCGRNMGVLEEQGEWGDDQHAGDTLNCVDVDPLNISATMEHQDLPKKKDFLPYPPKPKGKAQYIHGNTGMLLHLPESNEYLGILHQHRPHKKSDERVKKLYAPFGHHYTHAFFTFNDRPPYKLTNLSNEFVFPAQSGGFEQDAENIQFASGLDIVERNGKKYVIIGYGIGDCESAVVEVEWSTVKEMLVPTWGKHEASDYFIKPKAFSR